MRRYTSIAVIDMETYYDQQFSLRAKDVSTTSYIRDTRFQTHCMGLQLDSWDKPRVYGPAGIRKALAAIDWRKTAILCHHAQFDGLILTHHYGVIPAFWLDTMSMSAMVYGVDESHSLVNLSARLGREAKQHASSLVNTKGKRELTNEELINLAQYCSDDVSDTFYAFRKLEQAVPASEMRIIDMTIRMYVEPTLHLDEARVEAAHIKEAARRTKAVDDTGLDVKAIGSAEQFAEALRAAGVEPPTKISQRTGLEAYAFAKTDLDFKALALHPDETVRNLIEARLRTKGGLLEARSKRLLTYAGLPLPIYLKYWAARTGRWGGGDKINMQNLPARGDGVELRRSLLAPPGHMLVISDASQIEARLNAWDAGQEDVLEAFARNEDLYIAAAVAIYGKQAEDITPEERFVAKTLVLACQYGAGAPKINMMFKIGAFGPPIQQSLEETQELVSLWRAKNHMIVAKWKQNYVEAQHAFMGQTSLESGCVTFEGFKGDGFIHLPNGTYIRYPSVEYDNETRQMYYQSKSGPVKLYGGLVCVAGDTLVLAERGWVRLDDVHATDRIHDGVEFVAHGGLVYKSVQDCTTVDGVQMTPEHEVLTDEGWKPALEKPRPYRPDLRHIDCTPPARVGWQENVLGDAVFVRDEGFPYRRRIIQGSEARANAELRVLETDRQVQHHPRHEQTPGIRRVALDAGSLPTTDTPSMVELWRPRDCGLQALEYVRSLLGRYGPDVHARSDAGPEEQRERIFQGQLPLDYLAGASTKPPRSLPDRHTSSGSPDRDIPINAVLPPQARPVFDIVNCGPRRRFVVLGDEGPFIVHNCENKIQALARCVLAEQLLRMDDELPYARAATTTHDEVMLVVPACRASDAESAVKQIMSTSPAWAPGLPLNAKTDVSAYYNKS